MPRQADGRPSIAGRLAGKRAAVIGAGQTAGRAMALLFAREGAVRRLYRRSCCRNRGMIEAEGGRAFALEADVLKVQD